MSFDADFKKRVHDFSAAARAFKTLLDLIDRDFNFKDDKGQVLISHARKHLEIIYLEVNQLTNEKNSPSH